MNALLMLDTNAVSAIVRGQANALTESLNRRPFCISVITEAELRFGLARRAVNADLRRIVEDFLHSADIRPWTSAAAQRYGLLRAELEALGKPLAPMDLLIATHALVEDCTLVSADRAFAQVPGLRVADWSAVAAAVGDRAQVVRRKLLRAGIRPADVDAAMAHARAPVRRTTAKTTLGKKPRPK